MSKMKLTWLVVAGFLLLSVLVWAAPLQNYSISYTVKKPDGTVTDYLKYYLRDGNRFRADYLHPDGVTYTIQILLKDKGLVWSLEPSLKLYFEAPLRADAWERAVTGVALAEPPKIDKTGTTQFLNYPCDIYEMESREWKNISFLEPSMNLILRSETKHNGETFQIREATKFSLEKPVASLFEIPAGYKRSE